MSIYLKNFELPSMQKEESVEHLKCKVYPFGIFPFKELRSIKFADITMFYGGNGSGKSTLLNLIAERLNLPRETPFNYSERFNEYVTKMCSHEVSEDDDGYKMDIPKGSKIITSDDIFNHVINLRYDNIKIDKKKEAVKNTFMDAKFGSVKFDSLDKYEAIKLQNDARSKTLTKFVRERAGTNIKLNSNGESALSYFDKQFESGKLYLLDEPENSLSPIYQIQLIKLILECCHYCDCQFIIATHSPFLLSMDGAKIYDLDSTPVKVKNWYELENVRIYYDFFKENEDLFN